MADERHKNLLYKGVKFWNQWRKEYSKAKIDLSEADLSNANLQFANLSKANLSGANLSAANLLQADLWESNLRTANLRNANLTDATLIGTDLTGADLSEAFLTRANLSEANLSRANLSASSLREASLISAILSETNLSKASLTTANFTHTDLTGADLTGADLTGAIFIKTNLSQAKLRNCRVYGLSVWDVKGIPEKQANLIITEPGQAEITVDDLEVAQFIYLLLKNEKLKNVIDTITSKAVLILGRFTEERKAVLNAIREELRRHNFTPILFDFDQPSNKDVLGTVETLARMVRFVIADLTDPSSIPLELGTVVPFLSTTPVLPIKLKGSAVSFTMFDDLRRRYRDWVLDTYEYEDGSSLIASLPEVIAPAKERAIALRSRL